MQRQDRKSDLEMSLKTSMPDSQNRSLNDCLSSLVSEQQATYEMGIRSMVDVSQLKFASDQWFSHILTLQFKKPKARKFATCFTFASIADVPNVLD